MNLPGAESGEIPPDIESMRAEQLVPSGDSRFAVINHLNAQFDKWALKHANQSNGDLIAFPPGHPNYPPLIRTHLSGNRVDHAFIDSVAVDAEPAYAAMRNQIRSFEAETGFISMLADEHISKGHNIVLVHGHEHLIDLALGLGIVYSQMDEMGKTKRLQTAIVLNTMLDRLGIRLKDGHAPSLEALSIGADHMFLSVPRTSSSEQFLLGEQALAASEIALDESALADDSDDEGESLSKAVNNYITAHNWIMRHHLAAQLIRPLKGMLLSVSPGGATDLIIDGNPPQHIMNGSNQATADMLQHGKTFLVPSAISYTGGWEPYMVLPHEPIEMTGLDSINQALGIVAKTKTELSAGQAEFVVAA